MILPRRLRVPNALLDNGFGFFDVLAVQVDGVAGDFSHGVVLAKNEFRGLLVVGVGLRGVLFALFRVVVGRAAVARVVGLPGLRGEVLVLALFFAGEVSQAVVFLFGRGGGAVVEGWEGGVSDGLGVVWKGEGVTYRGRLGFGAARKTCW